MDTDLIHAKSALAHPFYPRSNLPKFHSHSGYRNLLYYKGKYNTMGLSIHYSGKHPRL